MRRIIPPVCSICHTHNAMYESDVWPTLKLCHDCQSLAVQYIYKTGILHGNALLIELAAGLDNGDREDAFRIWVPVLSHSSTYMQVHVKFEDESSREIENPLDFLDEV